MNKLTILMCLICFSATVFLSACTTNDGKKVLNYQRKIQVVDGVIKTTTKKSYNVIDLSDGTKVNFNAPIGPSFDIE